MTEPKFDITPEKQAGVGHFFKQQLFTKPKPVRDVNLAGKTCIVTGANTGVGFETARQILELGLGRLILAVRNEAKGQAAAAKLRQGPNGGAAIEVWLLDLDVYDSVVAFAERAKSLGRLDIVVLNAGIAPTKQDFNANTGHEETIQVNYISTALLAILLLPAIKAARANQPEPTRMTIVSSEVSAWAKFDEAKDASGILAALDRPGKVDMLNRMMVSKLLGQLFIAELARRVKPSLTVINCASPGSIHDSEFTRDQPKTAAVRVVKFIMSCLVYSSAVGARSVVDAAVRHGEETHGQFLSFQKLVPMAPMIYTAEGKKASEQLWKETMSELAFAKPEDVIQSVGE